ncbi:alpha/beta fold hydrolase [Streptosporangium sp. NPDC000095]|uniref:alpha/beta fold hydrolase n=1 Tax=Streptosporangium sp. NPDC000095 TaxID=3366184 RepID=UPI0036A97FB5
MSDAKTVSYDTGKVISGDGTIIGYRRFGAGPGVVLMHGSMMACHNFMRLGATLSGDFTVYLPDRRGRGMSGPYGPDFTLRHAAEDVQALMEQTGARNVFGLSAGAIPVLRWALTCPEEYKIALYEPPLPVGDHSPVAWLPRYEREMARGRTAAALVTVAKGTNDDSRVIRMLPRAVLVPLMGLGMRAQARQADGDVPLKDLVPTMQQEARLVLDAADLISSSTTVRAEVLLLGGSRSARPFKDALTALHTVIPHALRVELPHLGHLAADNGGHPDRVAHALADFFTNDHMPPRSR